MASYLRCLILLILVRAHEIKLLISILRHNIKKSIRFDLCLCFLHDSFQLFLLLEEKKTNSKCFGSQKGKEGRGTDE